MSYADRLRSFPVFHVYEKNVIRPEKTRPFDYCVFYDRKNAENRRWELIAHVTEDYWDRDDFVVVIDEIDVLASCAPKRCGKIYELAVNNSCIIGMSEPSWVAYYHVIDDAVQARSDAVLGYIARRSDWRRGHSQETFIREVVVR